MAGPPGTACVSLSRLLLEHLHGEMMQAAAADRGVERRIGALRERDEF
jgi:hypothetical protein